jgi:pyruvate dehydrogenase E2 component (dihydrolipoamide acetyltransferase)
MQPVAVELAYIVTVEKNLTAVRQIELGEQVDDGTLSASCVADKCNDPARRRREGYLVKYGSKGIIRERDVPEFNASLERGGENLVLKRYFHIGVAVDTPDGLVVPVIRDADRKGVYDLARELAEMSKLARDKKLKPGDMQGGTFSISSLGGIGGTAFTPIINAPEVAILGVSRAAMRPVWVGAKDGAGQFMPRLMLPLSLSYDHRVIDGAAAARFTSYLASVLSDIRRSLL